MLTLQKGFCVHILWWLWDSERITLSRLELHSDSRGGEKEFDILVYMHAGLSLQFWACSQVERCVEQVLTLLKA